LTLLRVICIVMYAPQAMNDAPLLRVIDLETTGQNFATGGVVEIGWQDLAPGDDGTWQLVGASGAMLVNPRNPISPETSAVHHITDEDVAGAPIWHDAARILRGEPPCRFKALAAHRAAFEQRWCLPALTGGTPWICTYKCALRLWPDAPTFSNQGLRYWRRPMGLDRATSLPAHRAGPDAYVTAHHLRDMLALASVEQLLAWSAEPALLPRVPFGVQRGRRWSELDDAALERILRGEAGGNIDMVFSARMERARRDGGVARVAPAQSTLLI
jgi:exodeoxyribonuclease X